MLERAGIPAFVREYLAKLYDGSFTLVQFAGGYYGSCPTQRGVRQGCPASAYLFTVAMAPLFRWMEVVITGPRCRTVPCPATSSARTLATLLFVVCSIMATLT